MRKPHPTILSALTLALLLLFTACGEQSDIPHPVIAMPLPFFSVNWRNVWIAL